MSASTLPEVIQGGMGAGVSAWQLARAVSQTGQLGVVSGTALDLILARRLQDGDVDGDARRALAVFPDQQMAQRVLDRFFLDGGRAEGQPYRPVDKMTLRQTGRSQELSIVANFAEVWLAKEGHDGLVGVNLLEKIQLATPAAVLGAMLANVDVVLMGAGVPRDIPRLVTDLAEGRVGSIAIDVHGADQEYRIEIDAAEVLSVPVPQLRRPQFLAIVSAAVLASYLARDESTRPDGFVIEGSPAGGHNAPPRGQLVLDEFNEPVYGPRDDVNLAQIAALGLPFWLAGAYGTRERLLEARAQGAAGVQVGTLFALCEESGMLPEIRHEILQQLSDHTLNVRTDALASPTGFPFKVVQLATTLSDAEVYEERPRLCDLSYLRTPYVSESGDIGYRCPSEPIAIFTRKGGDLDDTVGRQCLCNALTANVGLAQTRKTGYTEQPLVTLGSELDSAAAMWLRFGAAWHASDVVEWLIAG
ncbi:MAG: nitronate monooxygenase [Actinobacteria bacterium]|nr:nitronate monooxygenase [Actinomycetota bacterium]